MVCGVVWHRDIAGLIKWRPDRPQKRPVRENLLRLLARDALDRNIAGYMANSGLYAVLFSQK